jgi:vitamin B12 transporter
MKRDAALLATVCAMVAATSHEVRSQSPDTTQLGAVVVSASKVPRSADVLTQAVTVISGDDLRARGVARVADALREVPGASLVQSGSFGAITSLFLRGGENRYTKVLLAGVAVNAPGGYFDFSHLTTDNIERIEIVRGPASVCGADAVTGIVQIFTRRGGPGGRASIGARGGTTIRSTSTAAHRGRGVDCFIGGAHHSPTVFCHSTTSTERYAQLSVSSPKGAVGGMSVRPLCGRNSLSDRFHGGTG